MGHDQAGFMPTPLLIIALTDESMIVLLIKRIVCLVRGQVRRSRLRLSAGTGL